MSFDPRVKEVAHALVTGVLVGTVDVQVASLTAALAPITESPADEQPALWYGLVAYLAHYVAALVGQHAEPRGMTGAELWRRALLIEQGASAT